MMWHTEDMETQTTPGVAVQNAPACEDVWSDVHGHYQTCDHRATQSILECTGFVVNVCAEHAVQR